MPDMNPSSEQRPAQEPASAPAVRRPAFWKRPLFLVPAAVIVIIGALGWYVSLPKEWVAGGGFNVSGSKTCLGYDTWENIGNCGESDSRGATWFGKKVFEEKLPRSGTGCNIDAGVPHVCRGILR